MLAAAAQNTNRYGLGSQRVAIEKKELAHTFQVRQVAPDILLFGQPGCHSAQQGLQRRRMFNSSRDGRGRCPDPALNVLQEAVQPEGDTRWKGLLGKIEAVCRQLPIPVIVKRLGADCRNRAALQLVYAGVAALDTAGAGGTSWAAVEYHRAPTAFHGRVARAFVDWVSLPPNRFSRSEGLPQTCPSLLVRLA